MDNSPFEGGTLQAGGMSTCEGQTLAQDLILNEIPGNKKEQTKEAPTSACPAHAGFLGGDIGKNVEDISLPIGVVNSRIDEPSCNEKSHSQEIIQIQNTVLPLGEIEGPHDYLTLKKQHLSEKRQRCENDPMSESFYKIFTRERAAAPPPHILTDEEVEAIKNKEERKQQETKKPAYCGKMYFPEKEPQPGDDITNDELPPKITS